MNMLTHALPSWQSIRPARHDPTPALYEDRTMRRLLYSLAALAGLLCGLTGCDHTAGVCDCDIDADPCCTYAPWYKAPPIVHPEHIDPLPKKL